MSCKGEEFTTKGTKDTKEEKAMRPRITRMSAGFLSKTVNARSATFFSFVTFESLWFIFFVFFFLLPFGRGR